MIFCSKFSLVDINAKPQEPGKCPSQVSVEVYVSLVRFTRCMLRQGSGFRVWGSVDGLEIR